MESAFFDISIILITGTLCATVAKWLRQPMIPAYIIAGVLLGPAFFNIITGGDLLEALSKFGIAFLLFLVGIELDLRKFMKIGRIGILLGMAQMTFAVGAGFLLIRFLGFSTIEALFLAIALGFSSTILVLKLLSERRELDTLHGQIIIGLMLTQDFIAILLLIFFDVFLGADSTTLLFQSLGVTFLKGVGLFTLALVASKYLLEPVFRYFARTAELLFLGAICWCLVFSMLALALGFSIEVGSLLAGISLSFLPYSIEIGHRIRSLRDFFLPIFFAVLGGQLLFNSGAEVIIPTVLLSLFVLFGSSVLVIGLLILFGYRSRTCFQAGLLIGQISEFSFVLVSMGFAAGIIDHTIVSLVALIGLVTMTLSTYVVEYADTLYVFCRPVLRWFERKKRFAKYENEQPPLSGHVILIGHHTMGHKVRQLVKKLKKAVIVIDNNPDTIRQLQKEGIPHVYGSMSDEEALEKAHVRKAKYIISTVPSRDEVIELLDYVRGEGIGAKIVVVAFDIDVALEFYQHGAAFVLYPTSISAEYVGELLKKDIPTQRKTRHIKELELLKVMS